jgi:hypothetical protein
MHYMVCISGFAGAGKDECAGQLTKEHHALQTGLADPGKRHMADAYGFTEQQLFGPSQFRNAGDIRIEKNGFRDMGLKKWNEPLPAELQPGTESKYKVDTSKPYWIYETPHPEVMRPFLDKNERRYVFVQQGDPEFWLSPREALQQYLEKMNMLDVYTWIRKGVEDQLLLATGRWGYSRMRGLVRADEEDFEGVVSLGRSETAITCFADFRHIPEVQYVRELAARSLVPFTPILVRVKRPSIPVPPYNHRSETEQVKIRDAAFDAIVNNDQDLPHLYGQIDHIIHLAKTGKIPPNPWQENYVIQNRQPEEGYAP